MSGDKDYARHRPSTVQWRGRVIGGATSKHIDPAALAARELFWTLVEGTMAISPITAPHDAEKLHKPRSAAKKLNVSHHALPVWRRKGIGPAWVCYGPKTYRYRDADLNAYIAARRRAPITNA
jgi:hypothetical protein